MAKFYFGMNQSLDGYVDHDNAAFSPSPTLYRHYIEQVRGLTGSIYGRRMYEIMRYFDDEQPDWPEPVREFGAAWRSQPKWVVSRTPKAVGPNATLIPDDIEATIRRLKAELDGPVDIAGTKLARSVGDWGLIDQYNLYLHPVVVGSGTPFFAGPRSPLRLVESRMMDEAVIRLSYVPA